MVLFIVCSFVCKCTYAQTWDEWFRQKKTQIQYLTQQVAALQVYTDYLKKGYGIARTGLQGISNIKNTEFDLHQNFFSSLSTVRPAVQKDDRVNRIISLQAGINEAYQSCYQRNIHNEYISADELSYIHSVFDGVMDGCTNDIADLTSLTTKDLLQLSDDERLLRINSIYGDMQDKYGFVQSFADQTRKLLLSRQKEQQEISSLKALYHIQ